MTPCMKVLLLLVMADSAQAFVPSIPSRSVAEARCSRAGCRTTTTDTHLGGQQKFPRRGQERTRLELSQNTSPPSTPIDFFKDFFGLSPSKAKDNQAGIDLESKLLAAIDGVEGRGRDVTQEQREAVDKAVGELEAEGGVRDAASSRLVDGSWRLLFTTTPGTASPVQRTFVGVDGFAIYQDIELFDETAPPTVTNVVDFGSSVGKLRVKALASTAARPMEGFVPRAGDGRFFGLNIIGVSDTSPPKDPDARIDFQFDEAGFEFKALPFTIPYPVPFRWLGDEVKGWIDITYLSERLRIARGNKGTLFVLQRVVAEQAEPPPSTSPTTSASSGSPS